MADSVHFILYSSSTAYVVSLKSIPGCVRFAQKRVSGAVKREALFSLSPPTRKVCQGRSANHGINQLPGRTSERRRRREISIQQRLVVWEEEEEIILCQERRKVIGDCVRELFFKHAEIQGC